MQAIDPLTGELVQDRNKGLLPPNNAQGHGAGFVTFSVLPDADVVQTGNQITASARVLFNNAPPEDTPVLSQPVDAVAPTTALDVDRVSANGNNYLVQWQVTDDVGGSGFQHVTLYVATDGGDYRIWQRQLTEASGTLVFEGQAGHTYEFLALASDLAGNRQSPGVGVTAEDDGTSVNLGTQQTVPETTPPNFGIAPQPSPEPSTSALFTEAERLIPAASTAFAAAEFDEVLRPFVASAFVQGIEQSHAEIGPMAIAESPDGEILVSGGPSRNFLYKFDREGGEALIHGLKSPIRCSIWLSMAPGDCGPRREVDRCCNWIPIRVAWLANMVTALRWRWRSSREPIGFMWPPVPFGPVVWLVWAGV